MPPLLHEIDPGPECPEIVRMIVEIPKNSGKELEGCVTRMEGWSDPREARRVILESRKKYLALRQERVAVE